MKKGKFLLELSKGLKPLSKSDRNDIIDFYEERISNAVSRGMTEEEVIDKLEPLDVIIKNTLSEFEDSNEKKNQKNTNKKGDAKVEQDKTKTKKNKKKIKEEDNKEESKRKKSEVKEDNELEIEEVIVKDRKPRGIISRLFGIVMFDVFVASWLILLYLAVFVGSCLLTAAIALTAFGAFDTTYNEVVQYSLFTITMGVAVLSLLLVDATKVIIINVIGYVCRVNLGLLIGKKIGRRKKTSSSLSGRGFKKLLIITLSVVTIAIYVLVFNHRNIGENMYIEPTYTGTGVIEVDDSRELSSLYVYLYDEIVEIELYDGEDILYEYESYQENKPTFDVNVSESNVSFEYNYDYYYYDVIFDYEVMVSDMIDSISEIPNWLSENNIFQVQSPTKVKIYLPRDLTINELVLYADGDIILDYEEEMQMEYLDLNSYNGSIIVNNVAVSDMVYIYASEGSVTAENVTAENIAVKSYAGYYNNANEFFITLDNITTETLSIRTYTSEITGTNINSEYTSVRNDYGDVTLENVVAINADSYLDVDTYDSALMLTNISVNEIYAVGGYGDVTLVGVSSVDEDGVLYVYATSGDIEIDGAVFDYIEIEQYKNYNIGITLQNITARGTEDTLMEVYSYYGNITMNEVYISEINIYSDYDSYELTNTDTDFKVNVSEYGYYGETSWSATV